MNRENILKVADAIENATLAKEQGLGFNMLDFFAEDRYDPTGHDHTGHECGTTACIAGWTVAMEVGKKIQNMTTTEIRTTAQRILGLSDSEVSDLFYAYGSLRFIGHIKPKEAATVLRHFAKTGYVDWLILEEEAA
jgi:hypothetical protein